MEDKSETGCLCDASKAAGVNRPVTSDGVHRDLVHESVTIRLEPACAACIVSADERGVRCLLRFFLCEEVSP